MPAWTAEDIPDQSGRTAIVTGANSGLGLVTARELARAGAHVILAVRNAAKGADAAAGIASAVPGAKVEVRQLDLASLASVRRFAESVGGATVDLLVNNGGIMMPPRSTTEDGFETQLATNHLGHFALTGLLLDALGRSSAARVVTVSSFEHHRGRIAFDDLQRERAYDARSAYQQSKMANVLFGLELDRRLRATDLPIISVLAHPGWTTTNLQTTGPTCLMRVFLQRVGNPIFGQHADRGALPQLYAATAPGVRGGEFYGPSGFYELRGPPKLVQPHPLARDVGIARMLWEISEELAGVRILSPG
jgi:NAD(P)-dependent dehydrogenase (short-subunit alcohol dehydrogenase family)